MVWVPDQFINQTTWHSLRQSSCVHYVLAHLGSKYPIIRYFLLDYYKNVNQKIIPSDKKTLIISKIFSPIFHPNLDARPIAFEKYHAISHANN